MTKIKFKVLKTKLHLDRTDALDLKPFLDNVDVSSLEMDFCPEDLARCPKDSEGYITHAQQDVLLNYVNGLLKCQ